MFSFGHCKETQLEIVPSSPVEMRWSLIKNIQKFHTFKCRKADSTCGRSFGSIIACNSTTILPPAPDVKVR